MSEDLTQNLPPRPFEERVLAELSAIRSDIKRLDEKVGRLDAGVGRLEARVDALEEKVDRRLQEARPIWEDVQLRLDRLESKFDMVLDDHNELRYEQKMLRRRVTLIEERRTE